MAIGIAFVAAFDLVCAGTTSILSDTAALQKQQLNVHFRIDLDAGRWCEGECKETNLLVAVTDTKIVLENIRNSDVLEMRQISRESGKLSGYGFFGPTSFAEDANCERAEFSGFPAKKF